MTARLMCALAIGLCVSGLIGCKKAGEESEPAPTASVVTQPAAQHSVEQVLTAYGTVEFVPARTRALTVQVESQIAERFVLPGTVVKQGQALLRLIPSATSRLDLDKAARDASVAVAEAQRIQRLQGQGLATDSELRSANAAADTAVALRDSLVRRIGAASFEASSTRQAGSERGVTLTAPIAGVVDSLTAQPGDVIPPGTLLLRVSDPNALYVRLGIEPQDAAEVHAGEAVVFSELFPRAPAQQGNIAEVDSRVDPQTRLTMVVVHPAPAAGLVPGSSVRARIVIDTHEHALTVPRSAVLYDGDQPFLYVAAAGKAQRRLISVGITDGDLIEILRGLKAGEPVVTGGNYELQDGMSIRTAAAPESHGAAAGAAPAKSAPETP